VHEVLSVGASPARSLAGEWPEDGVAGLLSAREREVLWWVSRGKANAEIATALYISESTVRKHLQSAYRKLGVVNRTAAVARLSGTDG
jgi:DNA-binding CsgD family transcriptional regulator